MESLDALFFIDANQYLGLYRVTKGKKLLQSIREQQKHIFITQQVVDEVQRNKLAVTAPFLGAQFQELKLRGFEIPDHLLDISLEPAKLRSAITDIQQKIDQVNVDLAAAALQTVQRISQSEDQVSKALAELFAGAIAETQEELQRARKRKERGNPPGKERNPLGDQLTWEQLLSHAKGKTRVWIVSSDTDYCIEHGGKQFLNALLYQDLARFNQPPPQVFCFDNIDDGIRDFASKTGVKADALPTPEESKEIKEEFAALPPVGWLSNNVSLNEAAAAVMQQHSARQRIAAFIAATMSNQGWRPGMPPDDPD